MTLRTIVSLIGVVLLIFGATLALIDVNINGGAASRLPIELCVSAIGWLMLMLGTR